MKSLQQNHESNSIYELCDTSQTFKGSPTNRLIEVYNQTLTLKDKDPQWDIKFKLISGAYNELYSSGRLSRDGIVVESRFKLS